VSRSAEGAQYESQWQAPSNAMRVAPGSKQTKERALKVRNIRRGYSALSELHVPLWFFPGATRLVLLGACPWLSYCAPAALRGLNSEFRANLFRQD